jgi:hypothetical protein
VARPAAVVRMTQPTRNDLGMMDDEEFGAWLEETGMAQQVRVALCPACHHPDHDPGACRRGCDRCELHTDEALDWVIRIEPDLLAERGYVKRGSA